MSEEIKLSQYKMLGYQDDHDAVMQLCQTKLRYLIVNKLITEQEVNTIKKFLGPVTLFVEKEGNVGKNNFSDR